MSIEKSSRLFYTRFKVLFIYYSAGITPDLTYQLVKEEDKWPEEGLPDNNPSSFFMGAHDCIQDQLDMMAVL